MIELDDELFGDEREWHDFKGWDYEELADKWGINTDAVELIRKFIMDSLNFEGCEEVLPPDVKDDMLEFLGKLIASKSEHNYGEYIFVGLLLTAAEDDATFAQYFCTLLPHMWT